jgi:hypothetical protein
MLHLAELRNLEEASERLASSRFPAPGSSQELEAFGRLQATLTHMFEHIFPDPRAARTVVVVPSLTMDREVLAKIDGVHYYEERMLFMLMLLRLPHTQLVYITSQPISQTIIDYYLNLLPGIPGSHARKRLTLISCHDGGDQPLTMKILERPRLLERIRLAISDTASTHMTCFNATSLERTLAVRLGIPIYSCDPSLCWLGTKSGSRKVFKEAGVYLPEGSEDLRSWDDIVSSIVELKRRDPDLRKVVLKLDQGFSGEGNAVFSVEGAPAGESLRTWIETELPRAIVFEASGETWTRFLAKFEEMAGIVEAWIEGTDRRSPSVQCRIYPAGGASVISTHDQVLGGPSGQIFLGCSFPASQEYRLEIQRAGLRVGEVLQRYGALGRFGVDFVSVRESGGWRHYAIEINLRKGGTTHPFLMLQFLTDGRYQQDTGLYLTPTGRERYYYASDNLQSDAYRGFTPEDLIDIAVDHGLHFHGGTQQGVVFHLVGALSEFGKLGVLCIGDSDQRARSLYEETVSVLNHEAGRQDDYRTTVAGAGSSQDCPRH